MRDNQCETPILGLVRHTPDTRAAVSPAHYNKQLHVWRQHDWTLDSNIVSGSNILIRYICWELAEWHINMMTYLYRQPSLTIIQIFKYVPNPMLHSPLYVCIDPVCEREQRGDNPASVKFGLLCDIWLMIPVTKSAQCSVPAGCHVTAMSHIPLCPPPPQPDTIYPSQSNKLLDIYFYFISESQHTVTNGKDTQNINQNRHNISGSEYNKRQGHMQGGLTGAVMAVTLMSPYCHHQQEFISQGGSLYIDCRISDVL